MTLWTPTSLGAIELAHRLAMAPMTRDRSRPDGVPTDLNREYYRQRASMALIITEGTQPSDDGQGYLRPRGIHTEPHIAGWQEVTGAVHAAGGRIVVQLMHVGRIAHAEVVDEYRRAASAAIAAGFDGVEIHRANGYLPQQFLSNNANRRTDRHGGSIANRIRFAVEVVAAVADEIGADRTGLRISPVNPYNDVVEHEVYSALVEALAPLGLAYLHVMHPATFYGGDHRGYTDYPTLATVASGAA
jgi:N-ethylmaleimide reductase